MVLTLHGQERVMMMLVMMERMVFLLYLSVVLMETVGIMMHQ